MFLSLTHYHLILCFFNTGMHAHKQTNKTQHTHTALLSTEGRGQGYKLWTGLIRDPEHGWQWSNGRPYRYLNWDSGKFSFHFSTLCCYSNNAKMTSPSDINPICLLSFLPYAPCCHLVVKLISRCFVLTNHSKDTTLQIFMEEEDFWQFSSLDLRLTVTGICQRDLVLCIQIIMYKVMCTF